MADERTMCADEAVLLWYAAGALDGAEEERVRRHVEACERCRRHLAGNEEIARLVALLPPSETSHPRPAELAAFAAVPVGSASRPAGLEEHLRSCRECREIVDTVRRVERDLARAEAGAWWSRLREGLAAAFGPWLRSPVPAYLALLLLAYPAYRGLVDAPRLERLAAPRLLAPGQSLDEAQRQGEGASPIAVAPGEGWSVVTFFLPVDGETYRYRVELVDEGGRAVLVEEDAVPFDGLGTFVLLLPDGSVPPGRYEVRVTERSREDGRTEGTYAFALRLGDRAAVAGEAEEGGRR